MKTLQPTSGPRPSGYVTAIMIGGRLGKWRGYLEIDVCSFLLHFDVPSRVAVGADQPRKHLDPMHLNPTHDADVLLPESHNFSFGIPKAITRV
eukprot:2930074-Rhodomonas_salina.2